MSTRFWSSKGQSARLVSPLPHGPHGRRALASALSLLALVTLLGGCKMFERTVQCEALANATNTTLEQVAALDSDGDEAASPDAYTQIARHYQQLDDHLTALGESQDKEFGAAVSTLRAVLRTSAKECERFATHLRDLTEATEQGAAARVTSSNRQLQTVRSRMEKNQRSYAAASERIGRLCSPQ